MNQADLELMRDYLDDRISPERLEQLNHLLESDPCARAEFRAMATIEEGLRDLSIPGGSELPGDLSSSADREPPNQARLWYRNEHRRIAALILACCALAIVFLRQVDRVDEWGDAIARIEYLSEDVAFAANHGLSDAEGSLLGKGWIQLEQGHARILFRSGAAIEVEGPAALGIDTPMRAYLDYGKVAVHVPESARDFIVATESMEVVDLGTRFEITVDRQSRESSVTVIEGMVDLHLGSRGVQRTIRPLEAGSAVRVEASGKIIDTDSHSAVRSKPRTDNSRILAHWTFDEMGADNSVRESTGHFDGILRAEGTPQFIPGIGGQGLVFAGNTSVDLSKHVSKLSQLDAFTLTAWVRDPSGPLSMLFTFSGETEQQRIQLFLTRKFIRYGWQNGLFFDSIAGGVEGLNDGQWHHVAVTVGGGVVRLYCDAVLRASGAIGSKIGTPIGNPSMVKNPSHAYLGRLEDGVQGERTVHQWYLGQMDDVQLHSGTVGQEGIRFIFENPGTPWNPHLPLP